MIEGLLSGILLGLTMAIMLGPALFSLLQTSIRRGFRYGMFLAIGIIISDFVLVALSYLGVSAIITKPGNTIIFGLIGGIIMILFGVFTFRKKTRIETVNAEDTLTAVAPKKTWKFIAKGFLLNFANPFLLIFWMGWMAYIGNTYGPHSIETLFFFAGTLTTVFATDLLKCFIAGKIKKYLKPKLITIVNYILGLVLIVLGVLMIIRVTLASQKINDINDRVKTELNSLKGEEKKEMPPVNDSL
jgi:threonine/homoserine/homoserine lactone efflux protein